jgi:hypothetical protein
LTTEVTIEPRQPNNVIVQENLITCGIRLTQHLVMNPAMIKNGTKWTKLMTLLIKSIGPTTDPYIELTREGIGSIRLYPPTELRNNCKLEFCPNGEIQVSIRDINIHDALLCLTHFTDETNDKLTDGLDLIKLWIRTREENGI